MNLHNLEAMIAISEEKSISKAAEKLLISQPALSRQLKLVEQELDAKMFQREHNHMVLTDAGKVYLYGAQSILNIYDNALAEIKKLRTSVQKQITFVYDTALLPSFIEEVLPHFRELHENISVHTIDANTSIAKEYLLNGMADLAVSATKSLSHSILEYISLYEEELLLALPCNYPHIRYFKEHGVDFEMLHNMNFILNQASDHFGIYEREILKTSQFTPNGFYEVSGFNTLKHMIINHKGAGFLPKSMEHDSNRYTCFPLNPPTFFYIVIAYHKGTILSKPVKDLIKLLLAAGTAHMETR